MQKMQTSLQQALADEGDKPVEVLKSVYHQQHDRPTFVNELLILLCSEPYQKAASWLLKHHVEQGNTLTEQEMLTLVEHLQKVYGWESRLHLLQILPLISIPRHALLRIEGFVRESLSSENKFVRAWAIQGMYELSRERAELQREVLFICEKAMLTESPSVKARVRKILAELGKA